LQRQVPRPACRKFSAGLCCARKIHSALDVRKCSPQSHAPVTITR
jgi:hypothetical protein